MAHWIELVIEGREEVVRAFVAGLVAGRGGRERADVVHAGDVDLEPATLGERLRELLARQSHSVVLVGPSLAPALVAALAAQGPPLELKLESQRAVAAATVSIRAEVFARETAVALRALLDGVPAGVRVEQRVESEELHPEGKGVELYAPLHEYAYRVSAELHGAVGELVGLRQQAHHLGCEVGRLHLVGVG